MRGTFSRIIAIDHVHGVSSGARDLYADLVHAPALLFSWVALYLLKFACLVIALWYKLRGSTWAKSTRSSHGCLRQLFTSCQLAVDAFCSASCFAATFTSWLTLEVIFTSWCPCRTYILLLEGWASTYCLQWRFYNRKNGKGCFSMWKKREVTYILLRYIK